MSLSKQLQLIVETSRDGTNKTGKRKRKEQTDILQNEIIDQTPETPVTVPTLPNEIVPPEQRIFGQTYDYLVDEIEIQEVSESTPETEAVEIKQKIHKKKNIDHKKPITRSNGTKIWEHVARIDKNCVSCKICRETLQFPENSTSTGNIWKHKCIKQERSEVQTTLKFNGKPLFRPLNQKESDQLTRLLFKVIAEDDRQLIHF